MQTAEVTTIKSLPTKVEEVALEIGAAMAGSEIYRTSVHDATGAMVWISAGSFDRSEQGWRIPEACHLGQEASYLQLRVDTGFQPAKSLEHHAADTDRRIRLLAGAALDVGCCRSFALDAAEQARSPKGEAGDFARTVAIIRAHPGQQHADEPVVGKGIDQNAARGVVLHLSQYRRCGSLRVP